MPDSESSPPPAGEASTSEFVEALRATKLKHRIVEDSGRVEVSIGSIGLTLVYAFVIAITVFVLSGLALYAIGGGYLGSRESAAISFVVAALTTTGLILVVRWRPWAARLTIDPSAKTVTVLWPLGGSETVAFGSIAGVRAYRASPWAAFAASVPGLVFMPFLAGIICAITAVVIRPNIVALDIGRERSIGIFPLPYTVNGTPVAGALARLVGNRAHLA